MRLTTNQHKKYWQKRKIDWQKSYFNIDHPHRELIIQVLHKMIFSTVYEIGCASGANLYRIVKAFRGVRVGGVDINEEAVDEAKKRLPGNSLLEARSAEDLFMNDKSVCVLLSDMVCIYYSPRKIKKVLKEITRITRSYIIFIEFHSESWLTRFNFWRQTGYFSHNFQRLLSKYGFYDLEFYKLKEKDWPGNDNYPRFLITAKL